MSRRRQSAPEPRRAKASRKPSSRSADAATAAALASLKPIEFARKFGSEELRRFLEGYNTKELRAYVQVAKLSRTAVSSLTKDDAINRILGSVLQAA